MLREDLIPLFEGLVKFFLDYLTPYTPQGQSESVLVTGPTTSPENSYIYKDPKTGVKSYRFLTMAPHFDVAVLKETIQAYQRFCADPAAAADAKVENDGSSSSSSKSHNSSPCDSNVRAAASKIVAMLPNKGVPIINPHTEFIQEYLEPYDVPDPSHRHFSGLWYVLCAACVYTWVCCCLYACAYICVCVCAVPVPVPVSIYINLSACLHERACTRALVACVWTLCVCG